MHKSLPIFGLGMLLVSGAIAADPDPASISPVATVRVALIRDMDSMGKTIASVFQAHYEGNIRVVKMPNGKFTAINTLGVEDFLKGVIGHEMSPSGPLEALKAQAIAARTHALFSAEDSLNGPYDLVANLSQAYRGTEKERRVLQAVDLTRNEVITFKGSLVPTFFSESCGGHTASIQEVWSQGGAQKETRQMPPTVYCPACSAAAEHHQWATDLTQSAFTQKTKSWGSKIGELMRLEVLGRTSSGRVMQVKLIGSQGDEVMTAEKLRSLLGYNVLKSGCFEVEKTSTGILFKGEGWGHGVGLCQFGAQQMAEHGATYKEILAHYFPGSKIVSYKPSEGFAALQSKVASAN